MKQAPRPHSNDRISGLDGLRALAALAVFGVHYNQIVRFNYHVGPISIPTLLANGNHGVSLFFTLSGFLLSLPFWRAMASGDPLPSMRVYTLRRIARILPAYYVALTTLIFLGNLWRIPDARMDIILHYTFLFNYTEFSIFSINPPFWTLAIETQFYLLLPCIFLLIRKFSTYKPWGVIIFLGIGAYWLHYWLISTVSCIVPWPFNPWLTWIRPYGAVLSHSILANLPHFLIGIAAGKLYLDLDQKIDSSHRVVRYTSESVFWLCFLAVLFLLGTGYIEKIEAPHAPYGLPVVPLLLAAMIFTAPMTHVAKRIVDGFVLRKLGAISYGIYIYHLPCLNTIDRYMTTFGMDASKHWVIFGLLGIVFSILISVASFVAVEKPIIKFVRKMR
ncbi:MAG: acyltransferase [Desulfobacteraceae bacterium]|nr:acyltransferase [Desulfobacteraceae bacterium]